MASGVDVVVARLRARREEIVPAIFARVRDVVPDTVGDRDTEYLTGLRAAVAVAVDYGLAGIEQDPRRAATIPAQALAQAQRAARNGVSLEAVLRRYMLGHALLWDYIMEEAERVELAGGGSGLREILRAQASVLDDLVVGVTREHVAELERAGHSREHRLSERVRALLAGEGEGAVSSALDVELDYDLGGEHVGMIARGAGAAQALRDIAHALDRRLLCVAQGEGPTHSVWAWLGGRHGLEMTALERAVSELQRTQPIAIDGPLRPGARMVNPSHAAVSFAVGEPARGLAGWRLTHQQAQAALVISLRRPERLTRYGDVALLASALKDEMLARALIETYVTPLDDHRSGGPVLRETLRAYFAAERNVSSAAAALGVLRKTVDGRLHTIEQRLGRTLHPCPVELELALSLDELGEPVLSGIPTVE